MGFRTIELTFTSWIFLSIEFHTTNVLFVMAYELDVKRKNGLTVRDYDKQWKYILEKENRGGNIIPGAFVDWDNAARNIKGTVFIVSSPEK